MKGQAMTIAEIQARLRAAHDRIGGEGRLSFAIEAEAETADQCAITHWHRPARYAPMMHRTVAAGRAEACLAMLDRYAGAVRLPSPRDDYALAAE